MPIEESDSDLGHQPSDDNDSSNGSELFNHYPPTMSEFLDACERPETPEEVEEEQEEDVHPTAIRGLLPCMSLIRNPTVYLPHTRSVHGQRGATPDVDVWFALFAACMAHYRPTDWNGILKVRHDDQIFCGVARR